MLDQNIAVILSTLLGGTLTVVGGFIANYYIQSSSDKISKRKEIRNMLEQVYEYTQAIHSVYDRLLQSSRNEDIEKEIQEIRTYLDKIELLVDFYLPPLKTSFSKYYSEIKYFITRRNYEVSLEAVTEEFRSSVTDLFKKKGYSYF